MLRKGSGVKPSTSRVLVQVWGFLLITPRMCLDQVCSSFPKIDIQSPSHQNQKSKGSKCNQPRQQSIVKATWCKSESLKNFLNLEVHKPRTRLSPPRHFEVQL